MNEDESRKRIERMIKELDEMKVEVVSEKVDPSQLEGEIKQEYPRKIEEPFVPKKVSWWKRLFSKRKIAFNPDIKQPVLQLIRDDGYTDWIEGVKPGLFLFKPKGKEEKRGIFLEPKKLTTLNMEPFPKMWIAYEREMSPYPASIYHDADEIVGIIRKIETNRNLLRDEAKLMSARMWFWVAIIGAVAVAIYLGFSNGWFDGLFGG